MTIPMSEPDITRAEREAVAEVLATSSLALGPRLERFEQAIAARSARAHGVGVSSGTAGLHLCMIAAGVGPGDLVLTTPFSFVASANAVLYTGARPLFVDIDPVTLNIDPEAVAVALKRNRRVRAILPVHVFGQPADMDPILDLARRHRVALIEDACEALGAAYKGRAAGSLGDAGVFAFYPNKQITTGEGGMVVTDQPAWNALLRSLRNQGRDADDSWLSHTRLGYNYRLDELSAALGLAQTERLDELLAKRARVAAWYDARLRHLDGVRTPVVVSTTTCMSWFVYVVRLTNRDHVLRELARRGIPSRPYFPPIHLQPFYRERFGFRGGEFPHTEAAGTSCLALPFFGTMREAQVDTVCGALEEIVRDETPRVAMVAGAAR